MAQWYRQIHMSPSGIPKFDFVLLQILVAMMFQLVGFLPPILKTFIEFLAPDSSCSSATSPCHHCRYQGNKPAHRSSVCLYVKSFHLTNTLSYSGPKTQSAVICLIIKNKVLWRQIKECCRKDTSSPLEDFSETNTEPWARAKNAGTGRTAPSLPSLTTPTLRFRSAQEHSSERIQIKILCFICFDKYIISLSLAKILPVSSMKTN